MKKLFLVFTFLIMGIIGNASAQSQYEDVVYLKNGSIIHGIIIEQTPNESIKIKTDNNNIFVYKMDEIQKMAKEEASQPVAKPKQSPVRHSQSIYSQTQRQPRVQKRRDPFFVRYSFDADLGFIVGTKANFAFGDYGETSLKSNFCRPAFSMTHGVQIYKYAFAGLGFGVQYMYGKIYSGGDLVSGDDALDSGNWKTVLVPLYFNVKGIYPINDKFAPFVNLSLGYTIAIPTNKDVFHKLDYEKSVLKGGFNCAFGVGLRIKHFQFGFGLQHQQLSWEISAPEGYDDYWVTDKIKIKNNAFYINVGVNF